MMQRVGIAQALINDPEVVFLDEPMSGPRPARPARRPRARSCACASRGRTVFFSSHILVDAEALCSRVAILAGGRLAAAGRLADILAFRGPRLGARRHGPDAGGARARCAPRAARVTALDDGRYGHRAAARPAARRRPSSASWRRPARGVVSLNPLRDTLEDFFVQQVAGTPSAPRTGRCHEPRDHRPRGARVFRESVRDRVLYNLVAFAVAAHRRVVPASAS